MKNKLIQVLLASCLYPMSVHAEPLCLGAIEYIRDFPNPTVTVAFYKEGKEWLSGNPLRGSCTHFTVTFDGKQIGTVTTKSKLFTNFAAKSAMVPEDPITVPKVGKESTEFAGWTDRKVYRPLVVISQPNFKDPEQWKPKQLSATERKLFLQQFKADHQKPINCSDTKEDSLVRTFTYSEEQVGIIKAYVSKSGAWIAGMQIDPKLYKCDGPLEDEWLDTWYYLASSKKEPPILLGREMTPLDAADYDNDGKSEFIFFSNEYNRNGYTIFYNDFLQHTRFSWGYH